MKHINNSCQHLFLVHLLDVVLSYSPLHLPSEEYLFEAEISVRKLLGLN